MFELTIESLHDTRKVEIDVAGRSRLLSDILHAKGLSLNTRCGSRGLCDSCLVELRDGRLSSADGRESVEPRAKPMRACRLTVPEQGRAVIHIPSRSLLAHQPQVVTSFRLNVPRAHDPLWQQIRVPVEQLPAALPTARAIGNFVAEYLDCELPLIWKGGEHIDNSTQADAYDVVVQHCGDHRQLQIEDHLEQAYGVAVDVGTTTVVVALVDLNTGDVVADATALNAQAKLGDNVLTRINLCSAQPHLVQRMQKAIVRSTLSPLISDALRQADVGPHQLTCIVVAGNTTMLHLLLGVDPTSLGTAPFTPTFLAHTIVTADELSLTLRAANSEAAQRQKVVPDAAVHLLPGAAAYVGADITAGVLASGMAYSDVPCLLVDLGTNGEIVLRHRGVLWGCATAAGPAFEGAGLAFGMRAGDGAVGHIWVDDLAKPPRFEVIGDATPIGICGTAFIDFMARARTAGWISPTARLVDIDSPHIVRHPDHGRAVVIFPSDNDDTPSLLITEADMASLLQAKAAIAAGIICLLREAELQPQDVQTVYLAGGFGFHMHVDSILGCGMLPGFTAEQIEAVGNTALGGAYLSLLDSGALMEMRRIGDQMKVIELNHAPDFEMIYIDQLSLPQ